MTFEHWAAFAVVAALNIVTPGPTNLLIMNTGARFGRGPILAFAVGNILNMDECQTFRFCLRHSLNGLRLRGMHRRAFAQPSEELAAVAWRHHP